MIVINKTRRTKLAVLVYLYIRMRQKRNRTMYVRKLFAKRAEGETLLLRELEEDILYHHSYYRMNTESLEILMQHVGPRIVHYTTHAFPITANQRLALTIRYIATGNSQKSMALSYRISPSAVSKIIPEVLKAIRSALQPIHIPSPTSESWKSIANDFWVKWNVPNCLGAIDGKHVRIIAPDGTGSQCFNHKKFFSTVLMATTDAKYRFTVIDVGAFGSEGDSSILKASEFGKRLDSGTIYVPEDKEFPDGFSNSSRYPHVFLADEAFPLKRYIMRPYPGKSLSLEEKIFNYRLSRGRRVVENAFGILAAKFRIFHVPIHALLETVDDIVWATCCLHNFLIDRQGLENGLEDQEVAGEVIPGTWRPIVEKDTGLTELSSVGSNNYSRSTQNVREEFKRFFNSPSGSVAWQLKYVTRGCKT